MVSKNNVQVKDRYTTKQVPHYGIRKLSVGVASVLLSTTLYMGVTAHADTIAETNPQPTIDQPASTATGNATGSVQLKPTADQSESTTTNSPASETNASSKPVQTVSPEQPANATDAQPTAVTSGSQLARNFNVESDNNGSVAKPVEQSTDPATLMTNFAVTEQPVNDTNNSVTTTLTSKFTWAIHYTDDTGKKLLPDSVITHDYTRTDTGDQMGNWSYVPNSLKVTGTSNNGWHIDNPNFKFDQAAGGTTFDFATWYAAAASIDGYTPNYVSVVLTDQLPKNPESLHATSTVDSGTHEFTFVYTKQPTKVTINYVDDEQGEKVVGTGTVSGKSGTAVTITPSLPSGYMLTPNKDVPSTYTVTDAADQAVTIHVQKQFVDTSATDPQAKQTRTITLHYVYGAGDKQGQPAFDDAVLDVYYHRTATLNRATNQTTYGDWSWDKSQGDTSTPGYHVVSGKWTNLPQSWANVTADVPSIKGYYADLDQNDPTNTNHVPSNTWVFPTYNNSLGGGISEGGKGATAYLDGYGYEVSPTHTIKYMPSQTTVTVNYVDDDNNKVNVGSQHWNGTTGQHINLTLTPPANYVLSPGWVNPSSYDFDGVNSAWYTVHVKHATQDVTDQQSKDQISKTETLTRKHLYGPGPHEGEKFGEPDILEVPWHRTATKDLVTNKVSFGDWHVIWDEVKQLSGATKMWGDSEHNWVNGGLIAGHSGYSYLGIGSKTEAISTDGKVSGHGWYWMGEQDIEKHPTIVQYYGREKVGVPVNYVDVDTNQQLATKWLTGDDYLDGNTITFNKGDLADWGKAVSNDYQLYADQKLPTTYKIDTVSNDGNLTPITVYVVQPRTVQFTFVDNDSTVNGQHPQVGDVVSVTGITGSTTSVNLTIPAGYKLVEGQQLPTTYTFVKGETKQVILLTHQHVTVQADTPKTPSDKLPDNPGKNYPSGVAKDDLTKTITRKVTIVTPDGKSTVTNQTVTFTRNATVDEVTGKVTYGSWSENGKHEFATVDVPTVSGYTATSDVPSLTVTPDSKDTNVTINYTANDQTTQVVFVDKDGKTIDTVDVNGKTGETVETNAKVPDKWKLVDNETVPSTITFSADTPDKITVHVEHKIETKQLKVDTNVFLPRLIKAGYGGLFNNQGYTLWINDDEFNSKEYWFGKPVDVGSVTGSVQYDLVSGKIVKVNNGETLKLGKTLLHYPSDDDVANGGYLNDAAVYDGVKKTFTDELNEITHENLNYKVYASANLTKDLLADKDGVISHYFVHDNEILPFTFKNGKQYGSDYEIDTSTIDNSFSISFNDLIKNIEAFDINENDDGSLSTNAQLVTPIAYQPYISKTVTRTINITNPNGTIKTIKQTAEINQNVGGDYDWKVHHGEYLRKGDAYVTDNNWSTYDVPTIDGYTASQKAVEAVAVDENTTDQTVDISYTANKQQVNINYVDISDGNKVVHTTTINGVTDGDSVVPNELPAGYKLVDGQSIPKTIHFNADNNDDINIEVQHATVTVTPDTSKTSSDKLPDNPDKSYPSGVSENDLNKTITRTIKVTTPNGQTKTVAQTVKLTRTATVDEVTGEVTYGKWSTGQWGAYDVPTVPGYTASQTSVEITPVNENTKDQTVDVSYTPNKQSTTIKYVDDKGEIVHTTTVNGATDQTVKVPSEVPAGWTITNGQVPSEITFGADGHKPIEVTVAHQHVTVEPDHPQTNSTKLPDNPAKTFNGVEANDLNKTITRTTKVTTPDGQTKTVEQTVHLTRTADVDEVTGEVTYGNWTTGAWDAYEVPALKGYTASQTSVAATPVDGNMKDQTINISYTANSQTTHISYVDDNGKIAHTTIVNGVTGQTVKVPNEVPAGWTIVKGQVPSEISFGPNGHSDETITISHQHVTVDPDHPQTNGTELPDNPAKTFNGVEANDLNKTITRTIKVTTPDGKATTTKQTVKLTRTADVDEVTGEVTYGKWTTGEWNTYEVPVLNGYTASQTSVEAAPVDENTKDQTVEVSYTPNKQSTTIKYVDDKGDVVHTTTVTGVTDQTVKVPDEVPAGWTITKGKVPSEMTFGVDGHEPVVITVGHQYVTVDPDHPQTNGTKLPDNPAKTFEGVEANDLNKVITRTIKVTTPDGQTKTVSQTAKLTRTADVDEVTGEVTYGKWTTGQWNAYEVPALNGYTASQTSVEATPVDENAKDQTVEVSYTPNSQSTTIKYVDDKGQTIHTTTVNGVTNQTVKVPSEVPAGWTITKGKVPSEITFGVDGHEPVVITVGHQHVTVDPDYPQNNGTKLPDNPAKTFEGVEANDLNKTITRTIKVTTPDGKVTTAKQTAKLTRTADVDEVTGEVTYGDWTTDEWAVYDAPSVAGYTPSQAKVDKELVTAVSKDTTTLITYSPMQHQVSVEYVDDDDHGKVVKTDRVPGKTDQTITVTPSAPANYDLVDNGNRTYTVTSDDGQTVQIHVKHHQVTTSESKTVTRTINVYTPHDGVKTVKQIVTLNRDVTTDQVTGDKTYGGWTTGQWKAYTPEAISGYTPSTNEVLNVNVNSSSNDNTVDVTYAADAQKVEIVYVDDAKDGVVVKTDQVSGKTDETVKVTPDVPAGYKVVGEVPGSYTLTANGHQTITVHLAHQTKTTSENKTVTRTINVHTPHDGVKMIKQTAMLIRTVTTDQVTGEKTYGDWSATLWDHYAVPAVAGYVSSIKQVAQQVVNGTTTDQTIDVTYSSGEHTTHINYVDGDGNTVHTTTIKGQTDGTAQVPNETPAGWTVVGEPVPTELAFGPDGHADVTVTVGHQHVTVTPDQPKTSGDKLPDNPAKTYPNGVGHDELNKTITRTIKITTPDGQTKTVEQTAKLTRTADVDEVTGEVTYGKWTTGAWSNYDVPAVSGYTPSQSEVSATKVTDTTKNQTVTIGYMANNQTTYVNYVDGDGKTVHTTAITGKTDQTVKVPNEVPTGWTVTDGQVPDEITFGPNGHAGVTVTISHKHVTITSDQPKTSADKLPDNPAKTYPSGVGYDDLNKTITRTIKITTPDGQTKTVEQTAKLTRTADVDEVTGKVTYGDWTTGEWSNYDVPVVPGYTSSQSEVPTTKVDDDTKNETVTVTYTANDQTTHVKYVDGNGKIVHTTIITGKTDQTVKVPNEMPAGWTITNGQVPTEITFGPDGHADVTVTVGHQHVTVTPDQPKTPSDKLPNNPSKTYPSGVGHDDLNKTITRTIEVATPSEKIDTIKQTAKLTRTADVDEVTGEVTYGKWTTGAWSSYSVPTVPGYTPSQAVVAESAVYADTTDQTVKITYTADSHTSHINYVDEGGNVVHTTTVTGQTDQTIKVPNETPAGWMITTGQVPSEVTFGADGHTDVTVSIDHQTVTVTPDDPKTDGAKLPDNPALTFHDVDHDDLNKTITRTIKLNVPGRDPQVITQTAHLTRTATVDEVTGEVTYGDWTSGQWDAYEVPTVDGYTASQTTIPAVNVTSETTSQEIVVDYVAVPKAQMTSSNNQTDENQVTSEKVATGTVQETKQDAIKNSAQSTMQDVKQLPQTGNDNRAGLLSLIGSSLMAGLAVFGLGKKKKHEN